MLFNSNFTRYAMLWRHSVSLLIQTVVQTVPTTYCMCFLHVIQHTIDGGVNLITKLIIKKQKMKQIIEKTYGTLLAGVRLGQDEIYALRTLSTRIIEATNPTVSAIGSERIVSVMSNKPDNEEFSKRALQDAAVLALMVSKMVDEKKSVEEGIYSIIVGDKPSGSVKKIPLK